MATPEWVKPALLGAVSGAVGLAVVGFSWGGWLTAGRAAVLADQQSKAEVVAALVPLCLELAGRDPELAGKVEALKNAPSYQRGDMVTKAGWATMPGTTGTSRGLASACADKLIS